MKCYLKSMHLMNQEQILRDYGDAIWEGICDVMPEDSFKLYEVCNRANEIEVLRKFATGTRPTYIRMVLNNVALNPEPAIRKEGHRYFWN